MTESSGPRDRAAASARRMWQLLESYYRVLSSPDRNQVLTAAGHKGGWMTYFASRAAPLGPVPPEIVIRAFHVFAPTLVRRAIPDAWDLVPAADTLRLRLEVVDRALRRGLPAVDDPSLTEASVLAMQAAHECEPGGRTMFTANAALATPEEPHLKLWHASNLLREHRGDGHMAVLASFDLSGVESCVTHGAAIPRERRYQAAFRGWTEGEWQAAEERLVERGWLDAQASLTPAGRSWRAEIEDLTDELARRPWQRLGRERTDRLHVLLEPIVQQLTARVPG